MNNRNVINIKKLPVPTIKNPTKNRPIPRPTLPKNRKTQTSTNPKDGEFKSFEGFAFGQGF